MKGRDIALGVGRYLVAGPGQLASVLATVAEFAPPMGTLDLRLIQIGAGNPEICLRFWGLHSTD